MATNTIDPAYIESDCPTCFGRGAVLVSDDPDCEDVDICPTCDGTRVCECCPCGDRVPMEFVPDEHGVRLCGGEGCDGFVWSETRQDWIWARVHAEDVAEAQRLLNGRDPEEDEEPEDETAVDTSPLTIAGAAEEMIKRQGDAA